MEIIFLGTSSGVPTKSRNVSATAVKLMNSRYWNLIDCGEGTQQQLQKTNLSLNKLSAIYITHVHGDHCYGLPGLLASASMSSRTDPLLIVGPPAINDFIASVQQCTDLRLSYEIIFREVKADIESSLNSNIEKSSASKEFDVHAIELSHRVPSFAYRFTEKNIQAKLNHKKLKMDNIQSGPVWGKIQQGETVSLDDGREIKGSDYLLSEREPRKIIISGDNDSPHLLTQVAASANVLVHESTYTEKHSIQIGAGPQHSDAKRVAQFAQQVSISNLVLTHFSARYQDLSDKSPSIADIENEARDHYKGQLFLANDFDVYQLSLDGNLVQQFK
ncbi:Ribonuclease Z [hydrothermal vent metagenome]|uniref:Ribonuclease Z n=1 Tax=hydrothermal vent metagenome TaxID=652676 RepID=A0A3B0XXV4_9ZZZZ